MPMAKITFDRIPTLTDYKDFLRKAIYDYDRYSHTHGVYDLADCLLTLNSLPEWIKESDEAPDDLKSVADEKILIMKDKMPGFVFDEYKLDEIDQQLRFIRIFCNHAKHGEPKEKLPQISMGTPLPATFPITFDYIDVGDTSYLAIDLIKNVVDFWKALIPLGD